MVSRASYPDLIGELAIVKGETYRKLIENASITFPGDLTTATLRGQIRSNYVENGGGLLGTFSFEDSTYDAEGDITTINPYLTEFTTVNLPATLKYVEGREPTLKTNPVYDIELFINDEIIKKKPGFLQIIGEVTGGEVTFNPAEEWTAGIASVELIATVGFTKTYQIWGDEAKTVSLGTFDVIDTQPAEGVSGFGNGLATEDTLSVIGSIAENFTFTENGLRVALEGFTGGETVDITTLAKDATLTSIQNLIPEFTLVDGKLLVNAAVTLPTTYQVEGTVELGTTSLTALENITAEIDTTGLATDTNQETTNTKLETISDKIPTFIFDGTRLTVKTELTQPLTLTELQGITVNVSEQSPLDLSGLATKSKQDDLIAKLPNGLTVVGDRLKVDADVTLPDSYDVTGTISVDNFPVTQPVSGTVRNNPVTASTPTLTNVSSSAISVTLLAANSDRKTVVIVNDSTATLYVKFDASAASTTSYTLILPPIVNNTPSFITFSGSDYAGEVRGIWSSVNGFARITEVV